MKKLLWILLLLPLPVHGQQYTRKQIKHAADSIMHTFLRKDMFAATVSDLDNDHYVYYSYENWKGKIKYAEVPRQEKDTTKGWFKSVEVRYTMQYNYPKCPPGSVIEGNLYVSLDANLDMSHAPDIGFIPDYVWEQDSCRVLLHAAQ